MEQSTDILLSPVKQLQLDEIKDKTKELELLESKNITLRRRRKFADAEFIFTDEVYSLIGAKIYLGFTQKQIAKQLNISMSCFKRHIAKDEKLRQIIQENKKFTDSLALGGLIKHIMADNLQAIMFYLKNRMDEFKDKAELNVKDGNVQEAIQKLKEQFGIKNKINVNTDE